MGTPKATLWVLGLTLLVTGEARAADAAGPPTVVIEVVDGAGKPIPGARVVQGGVGSARARMHGTFNTYETDQKGLLVFNFTAGSAFSVSVSKPGTVSLKRDLAMPAQGEVKERFVLVAGANVSGSVIDAAGLAVGNAQVIAYAPNCTPGPANLCMDGIANAGADGAFTLTDIPPGPHKLWVGAPGGRTGEKEVTAPAKDVKIVLAAAATLAGKVLRDGKPVAGVKIFIEDPKGEPLSKAIRMQRKVFGPQVPGVSATTGADGKFSITGIAQQPYAIWAEGDGVESSDQVVTPGTELLLKLDQKSP